MKTKFRSIPGRTIVAVQLRLETEGLFFKKWGSDQTAKAGDWLVDNEGEVYTVDATSFENTYRSVSKGLYEKCPVYAEKADQDGSVQTKEGMTNYLAGSWIVSNNEDGTDSYAVTDKKFLSMYELDQ